MRFRSERPSGIECAALVNRLMNTWVNRPSSPSTTGVGANSQTSCARWRTSLLVIRIATSSTPASSSGTSLACSERVNARSPSTILRTRSAPSRASATAASISPSISTVGGPRTSAIVSAITSRFPDTYDSGLLISCAMPAASVPRLAIRSESRSFARSRLRSVTSRPLAITARAPPISTRAAETSQTRQLPFASRSRSSRMSEAQCGAASLSVRSCSVIRGRSSAWTRSTSSVSANRPSGRTIPRSWRLPTLR